MRDEKSYEDIRNIVYPVKTDRPRMSMHDRAAQFSPFAALTIIPIEDVISLRFEE